MQQLPSVDVMLFDNPLTTRPWFHKSYMCSWTQHACSHDIQGAQYCYTKYKIYICVPQNNHIYITVCLNHDRGKFPTEEPHCLKLPREALKHF